MFVFFYSVSIIKRISLYRSASIGISHETGETRYGIARRLVRSLVGQSVDRPVADNRREHAVSVNCERLTFTFKCPRAERERELETVARDNRTEPSSPPTVCRFHSFLTWPTVLPWSHSRPSPVSVSLYRWR